MSPPSPTKALSHDKTQFPFSSPGFDPETVDGLRVQKLWNHSILFSGVSSLDYLDVVNGKGGKL